MTRWGGNIRLQNTTWQTEMRVSSDVASWSKCETQTASPNVLLQGHGGHEPKKVKI